MMQAGRDYGTRMMRSRVKVPKDVLADIFSMLCDARIPDEPKTPAPAPFRSVNQDKPVLRLK